MASLRVLAFDHESRPIQFDTWLDDLQLYVLAGQTCGKLQTQHRCFSQLDDAWRADFAAAALGAYESGTLSGTALAEALNTFTLDSSASRCFFCDSTTLTPLPAPVPVRLADPSRGLVVAHSSTVLPCLVVPSNSLSGLQLPSFSTNLVSTAALQGAMVTTTTPGDQRVSICTCSTPLLVSPPVALDSSMAPPPGSPLPATPSWHALSSSCLWSSLVPASPAALACPALPSLRRGVAARHSSLLLVSPDDCSPPDAPHECVGPCPRQWRGLRAVLYAVRLQLRERFHAGLPVLRLHSDRGGEFSSDLLREFCRGEGILQTFTLPDSPQRNGIAERHIGLVMEVARTSMIHAAAPHFLWSGRPPSGAVPGEVAVDSNAARGTVSGGAETGGAKPGGAESGGVEPGGAEPGGAEPEGAGSGGVEPRGAEPGGAESGGAQPQGAASSGGSAGASPRLSPQQLREWLIRRARLWSGATGAGGSGGAGAGGARVSAGASVPRGPTATGPGGARTQGAGNATTGGVGSPGAVDPTESGAAGAGGTGAGGAEGGGARVGSISA
ncbi:unnamed protein product [Closterium sp. NIES-54]